jgi:Family of unknown function (DUF6232)
MCIRSIARTVTLGHPCNGCGGWSLRSGGKWSGLSRKSETIEVQVSQRILWVGGEAYPLQNIARAQTIKLVPKRAAAFGRFLIAIIVWILLGVAGIVAINNAQSVDVDPNVRTAVVVVVSVLVLVSTIRLLRVLMERTLYALVIETAGSPRTALVTPDGNQVTNLVRAIMNAINNPQAEFRTLVQNIHRGDKIQQFGSHSVGKVSI